MTAHRACLRQIDNVTRVRAKVLDVNERRNQPKATVIKQCDDDRRDELSFEAARLRQRLRSRLFDDHRQRAQVLSGDH